MMKLLVLFISTTGESGGTTSGTGRGSTPEPSGTRAISAANIAGKTQPTLETVVGSNTSFVKTQNEIRGLVKVT
jgi:hypothetical protein